MIRSSRHVEEYGGNIKLGRNPLLKLKYFQLGHQQVFTSVADGAVEHARDAGMVEEGGYGLIKQKTNAGRQYSCILVPRGGGERGCFGRNSTSPLGLLR